MRLHIPVKRERRLGAMLLFGVGYGAASLGCTLPLFLTLIAASSGADKLTVFTAYAAGTAVVLMASSILVAGGYLAYYWARLRFGDTATVAGDPIVSFAFRFTGHIRTFADGRGSTLIAVAAGIVVVALIAVLLRWRRQTTAAGLVSE